jgi:hypothetical protein
MKASHWSIAKAPGTLGRGLTFMTLRTLSGRATHFVEQFDGR